MKYTQKFVCILLILLGLSPIGLLAQGSVSQGAPIILSAPNINPPDAVAVQLNWTADSGGSVPAFNVTGLLPFVGYRIINTETAPGSPAPTAGYTIQLVDSMGSDMAGGTMVGNLSATLSQIFSTTAASPLLLGGFSFQVSGNSVAGAKGRCIIYLQRVTQINTSAGTQGPAGPPGSGGINCSNYATLQLCHDALPSTGGVMFISGPRSIASVLTISKTDVTVQGGGWGTKLSGAQASGALITVTGNRAIFRDVWVENTGPTGIDVNIAANTHDTSFDHCRFSGNSQGVTVNALGVSGVAIQNSFFDASLYGVLVNVSATNFTDLRVVNSRFVNVGQEGINIDTPGATAVHGIQIAGNYCISPGTNCVALAGAKDVEISGNHFENCGTQCIHAEDVQTSRVSITGNTIFGTVGPPGVKDGIFFLNGSFISIAGNDISSTVDDGINITYDGVNQVKQVTITGNTVTLAGQDGIALGGTTSVGISEFTVSNNITVANARHGISASGDITGVKVTDNVSNRNTGFGLAFGAGPSINVTVTSNDFVGNTAGGIGSLPGGAISANNRP